MILGFKNQFVPYVLDGTKTHTIRAGERWKAGMRADLFAGTRQRKVFQLRLTDAFGCICHGDGLMGMECHAPIHAEYRKTQVAGMRLLFRAPVVRVETIEIYDYEAVQCGRGSIPPLGGNHVRNAHRGPNGESLLVRIEGEGLSADETRSFFFRDGFRNTGECPQYQALKFWRDRLPFHGQIVHWDYEQRFMEKLRLIRNASENFGYFADSPEIPA